MEQTTRERGGDFNLTGIAPGEDAQPTAIAMFGSISIIVDQGTQVTMSGFNLLGGREVTEEAGDGPRVAVRAVAVFGSVEVKPPKST